MNEESIPDIIKDVDCLQDTQQYSITIENNWQIKNICNLINSKRPGEKIESEQFSYEDINSIDVEPIVCEHCVKKQVQKYSTTDSLSTLISSISDKPISLLSASRIPLHAEVLCDYFISNSVWRLEINKCPSDFNFITVNLFLLHHLNSSREAAGLIYQNLDKFRRNTNLFIKAKVNLFNAELNDIYQRQTIEIKIDFEKFFTSLLSIEESNPTRLIERYSLDKFCKIKELLRWLNKSKSTDFCLMCEFKVYNQLDVISSGLIDFNSKSRLRTKYKQCQKSSSSLSSYASSRSISSSSPSPPPSEEYFTNVSKTSTSTLVLNFKHAWTIKNWRHFLMPGGPQTHTFMSDLDISNIFSKMNILDNDSEAQDDDSLSDCESIKFGKFRSKLFSLVANDVDTNVKCSHLDEESETKIKNLLKDVKWKLQLYPNGYSQEFEKNLSLFVNFSQLTGDLAQYSPPVSKRKSSSANYVNSKSIEEAFYDKTNRNGFILLIKCPSSLSSSHLDKLNQAELIDEDDYNFSSKKKKKTQNLYETFVKASFQISIVDSNGKKVDKCQSEKQLFELYGSWGYKEYMSAQDLISAKEKYLTNNHTTLNLNCKILLFYTITRKISPNYEMELVVNTEDIPHKIQLNGTKIEADTSNERKHSLTECNTLLYDMRRALKLSDMHDLIIQVPIHVENDFDLGPRQKNKFKQFKAHKLILAIRSEVFAKMFNSFQTIETAESVNDSFSPESNILHIVDFDALTVEIFINYLYTDSLEINMPDFDYSSLDVDEEDKLNCNGNSYRNELHTHVFIELFKMADKYCTHRLKQICEFRLLKLVNVETTVELLILSYLHNSNKLKQKCFEFLTDNVANIIAQPGWVHLERNYPPLLAEAFRVLYLKQNQ